MAEWREEQLGSLVSFEYGSALRAESRTGSGFNVYGSNGVVGLHDSALVSGPGIIIGRKGSVGALHWSEDDFWPIDTTYWAKPKAGLDLRWMREALGLAGLESLDSSTGVPGLNRYDAYERSVPVPPLEEQRRIAEILDTIDETIQATERVIKKLRKVRKGLLLDLLDTYFPGSGPLVPRSTSSKADCVVLSALLESGEIELGRGKVISSIDIADNPGPYPIYSSSASATGEFGRYGKFMFDEELITWSVDGGGRPFYRPRHRFSVTNVGGYLRIRARQNWSYQYVHALMEVQHAHLTFDWLTKAHPSVIRNLYWFPRIPLTEQHRITERLMATERSVLQLCEEAAKLNRVRFGLAADLLSGRVRTVAA